MLVEKSEILKFMVC
jgi:hypothetical protein